MAWTSDTIWCDPKFADVTDTAFRAYINANSYSSGFLLRGHLTAGQLKTIGATTKTKRELITVVLWHDDGDGGIHINDWDDHNGKRDDRRERDRDRKREQRRSTRPSTPSSTRVSAGQSTGHAPGTSTVAARGEGSEGSEGSEELQKDLSKAVPVASHDARGEPTERPQISSTIRTLIDASLKEHAA